MSRMDTPMVVRWIILLGSAPHHVSFEVELLLTAKNHVKIWKRCSPEVCTGKKLMLRRYVNKFSMPTDWQAFPYYTHYIEWRTVELIWFSSWTDLPNITRDIILEVVFLFTIYFCLDGFKIKLQSVWFSRSIPLFCFPFFFFLKEVNTLYIWRQEVWSTSTFVGTLYYPTTHCLHSDQCSVQIVCWIYLCHPYHQP